MSVRRTQEGVIIFTFVGEGWQLRGVDKQGQSSIHNTSSRKRTGQSGDAEPLRRGETRSCSRRSTNGLGVAGCLE